MKKVVLAGLLLFEMLIAVAQSKQPITHESLWLMKRVGTPAISPNGKWVIFSVQEPAYDEKEVVNDLWLVPSDKSAAPRRITANKSGETGYAWSPDGKQVAFVAKRDGDEVSQVYLLNLADGGEAQKLTTLSTGAGSPVWSPNGQNVLFTSNVYPGAFTDSANKKVAEQRKNQKYKARVYTSFPVRDWDHWIDEKMAHLFVQQITPGSRAVDLFSGMDSALVQQLQIKGNAYWTADSKSVLFAATNEGSTSAWQDVPVHLYRSDLDGKVRTILSDSLNSYASPAISADGKYLYCLQSAERNYKVFNSSRLVRYSWPSLQNKTMLAGNTDFSMNGFQLCR